MSQTLINGTAYEIEKGNTMVNSTQYTIDHGNTLVGGTGYVIEFGSSWEWGNDGDTVDTDWFAGLSNFLQNSDEATIKATIPLGSYKTITLSTPVAGYETHDIMVVGRCQDASNSVTFRTRYLPDTTVKAFTGSKSKPPYTDASSNYYNVYCPAYYNAHPGKDYILNITKSKRFAQDSYDTSTGSASAYVWVPGIAELYYGGPGYAATSSNILGYYIFETKAKPYELYQQNMDATIMGTESNPNTYQRYYVCSGSHNGAGSYYYLLAANRKRDGWYSGSIAYLTDQTRAPFYFTIG